jgi:hypothetical protein
VVGNNPITDEPIFFIADMPHLVKKLANALEFSSLKKSKQNMVFSGCPLNSKMIQDIWRLTRKKSPHRLMDTMLTEKHFNKNAFLRMVVMYAVQLMSSRVVMMIKKSLLDPSIVSDLRLCPDKYRKIIEMAENVDRLVDICNGRSKEQGKYFSYYTPESGEKIQRELLSILDWFTKWRESVRQNGDNKYDFIPSQSWKSVQSLILGTVGLIGFYVIRQKTTIVPKVINTDCVEIHFCNSLQSVGGGNVPTAQMQRVNDARATVYTVCKCPSKGKNASAPIFEDRKKF